MWVRPLTGLIRCQYMNSVDCLSDSLYIRGREILLSCRSVRVKVALVKWLRSFSSDMR